MPPDLEPGKAMLRRAAALALSFGLHILPFVISAVWLRPLELDDLGARGSRQWAEEIGLTAQGEGFGGPEAVEAEGRGGVLRIRLVAPFALEPEEHSLSEERPPEEAVPEEAEALAEAEPEEAEESRPQTQGDDPPEEFEEEVELAEEEAPAAQAQADGERARAPQAQGEDAYRGAGIGGSDRQAAGDFVSGAEAKEMLPGWTLVGMNGFADGSIGRGRDFRRAERAWRVYYRRDGRLQARFIRLAAYQPHGPLSERVFDSSGRWWIKGDHLCQSIEKWFYGGRVCFEIRRQGRALAMYYADCWGVSRCYRGRLGPQGVLVRGKRLR